MPTWNEITQEIDKLNASGVANSYDEVRKKYLTNLEIRVGRPVVAYYSGFLNRKDPDGRVHQETAVGDFDMNGMMAVLHGIEKNCGLDLILHTPGGGIEAGRSIVEYLYKTVGRDIRVIVPHMAMSVGTMIACAAKEILLGKHSSLGPTDPQIRGLPAMGVLAEVDRAIEEIRQDQLRNIVWQHVFAKYPPGFIMDCERAVDGARSMVKGWLKGNMFTDAQDPEAAAEAVVKELMNYAGTSEHGQHYPSDKCQSIGLKVKLIEDDQDLQEDILSVHHAYMATFQGTNAIKIIENSRGNAWVVGP